MKGKCAERTPLLQTLDEEPWTAIYHSSKQQFADLSNNCTLKSFYSCTDYKADYLL